MYNESYDDYIRSILGYPPINTQATPYNIGCCTNCQNQNQNTANYSDRLNNELESCYPEIYKKVYPIIVKKCANVRGMMSNEELENMTDEICNMVEQTTEIQLNINLRNEVKTEETKTSQASNLKPNNQNRKIETEKPEEIKEVRQTRQRNNILRDLIKILLIRELINRFPNRPRPPRPNPRPPMPPQRPQMRAPFTPDYMQLPHDRNYDMLNYDIFEY